MSVPLVESAGAVGPDPGQPQVTTMTGAQPPRDEGGVDFQAGGRESGPLLVIGGIRLGYEDVLLLVALVQVFASAVRLYVEVSD